VISQNVFKSRRDIYADLVKDVINYLCSIARNIISWPALGEMPQLEVEVKKLANFLGILGAIDGCHVSILAPEHCQNDYLDRNHNHSVNLLAVCDSIKKFTYCFAGYPGSVHDRRVVKGRRGGVQ